MTGSNAPASYSQESPPTIAEFRKATADRVVRDFIALYNRAMAARAEALASFGDDVELDPLMSAVEARALDAERALVKAIRAASPGGSVRCDGKLYAVAGPDMLGRDVEGDEPRLTVVDLADVRDAGTLEDDPVYAPDGERIYHVDDPDDPDDDPAAVEAAIAAREATIRASRRPPGPAGPRLAPEGPYHARPLPLLRTTHTVCAPWDPWPITFELIVLSATPTADEHTARIADVPELAQGGWQNHTVGPLQVFSRMIAP